MNKTTSGLAIATIVGFSALSATPAMAMTTAYENCTAAANDGAYNIPSSSPAYGPHLDSDNDGIGCEDGDRPVYDSGSGDDSSSDDDSGSSSNSDSESADSQVNPMPEGGVDTGVTQESTNLGALALGGGLVIAAAVGGTYLVRRRSDQA